MHWWAERMHGSGSGTAKPSPLTLALSHPTGRHIATIAAIFVILAGVSLSFAYFQERIQDGARAYSRGQGIWAKAQIDAVFFLQRYARTHREEDYERFREMVAIPLADREARGELETSSPDNTRIRDAFLRGQNHPDDIDALVWFYRFLKRSEAMRDATSAWSMADDGIFELIELGKALHDAPSPVGQHTETAYLLGRVDAVDAELRQLEERFSLKIREAAHLTTERLWRASLLAVVLLLSMGFVVSRNVFRKIERYQRELHAVATHDALTGLPNRLLFDDRLQQATKECHRRGTQFGIIFLDLDGFKQVNDSFGHEAGDKLLQHVAAQILTHVRDADTVTRRGGDEFAILLLDVDGREHVRSVRDRIVCSINAAHDIDGQVIDVGVSAGMSIFPDDSSDPDDLLRHADRAMYRMKGRHDGSVVLAD